MKKIYLYLFVIFSFFIFNSKTFAYSHVSKLTIDLTDNSNFNIFYEINNKTPLAQLLATQGNDLKSYLLDLDYPDDNVNYDFSRYAIWLDYYTSSDIIDDEITTNVLGYHISLDVYMSDSKYTFNYYFDNNMNYLSNLFLVESYLPIVNYSEILNFENSFDYLKYYEGNIEYYSYSSNGLAINKIYDGTKTYSLVDDDANFLVKFWHNLFKDSYSNNVSYINFDWFKKNVIIADNVKLTPMHNAIYNFQDISIDYNFYTEISLNTMVYGVVLVPKTTTFDFDTQDINFYAYTTDIETQIRGALVPFDNGVADTSQINFIQNANFGLLKLNKFNFGAFNHDNELSINNLNANWYDYVYYFYTDDRVNDTKIYYNDNTYDLIIVDSTGIVSVDDPLSGDTSSFNSFRAKQEVENIINETDYHYGTYESKYPTGIPTSYIDSGGDKDSYGYSNGLLDTSNITDKGKNLLSSVSDTLNGLSGMFKEIFKDFPEFYNILIFAFSSVIIIGVIKLIF